MLSQQDIADIATALRASAGRNEFAATAISGNAQEMAKEGRQVLADPAYLAALRQQVAAERDLVNARKEEMRVMQQMKLQLARARGDAPGAFVQGAMDIGKAIAPALEKGFLTLGQKAVHGIGSASPAAAATFQGSMQLFEMSLGRHLLPVVENFSRGLQKAAKFVDSMPGDLMGPLMGAAGGAYMGSGRLSRGMSRGGFGRYGGMAAAGGLGMAMASDQGSMGQITGAGIGGAGLASMMGAGPWGMAAGAAAMAAYPIYKHFNPDTDVALTNAKNEVRDWEIEAKRRQAGGIMGTLEGKDTMRVGRKGAATEQETIDAIVKLGAAREKYEKLKKDYKENDPDRNEFLKSYAGLPQSKIMGAADYHDTLQQAALNQDPIQTEILKQQLEYLRKSGELLEEIKDQGNKNPAPPVALR